MNTNKIMKITIVTISLILVFGIFGLAKSSQAANYYVSPSGSDINDGSIGNPWKTLTYAIEHTCPGDIVNLREGIYSMAHEMRGDTGNKYGRASTCPGVPTGVQGGYNGTWWTLQGYPGEVAIVQPPSSAGNAYSVEYCIFQNFTIASGKSFKIGPADWVSPAGQFPHNNIIRNLTYNGPQPSMAPIQVKGDNTIVEDNNLTITSGGSNYDHGIYASEGDGITIRNNVIDGGRAYGIHFFSHSNYPSKSTVYSNVKSANVIIENNIVRNSQSHSGILIGSEAPGAIMAGPFTIRNNIVYGNAGGGIEIYRQSGTEVSNAHIYNNTLYRNGTGSNEIKVSPGSTGTIIKNNIIVANSSVKHIGHGGYGGGAVAVVERNLYDTTPRFESESDTSSRIGDPLFVNPVTDFHIQSGSPAKDAGLTLANVTTDTEGIARPMGSFYDIGAYEYSDGGKWGGDTQAPSIPSVLTANTISSTQINLSWNASIDNTGVAGYRIYRNGTFIGTSTSINYSDTGLTQSTAYIYTVRAYDSANNISAESTSTYATTAIDSAPSRPLNFRLLK